MLKKFCAACLLSLSLLTTQLMSFAEIVPGHYDFNEPIGYPWVVGEAIPAKAEFGVKDGVYKIKVLRKGENRWDIQFAHKGISIKKDVIYTIQFKVKADKACSIYARFGDSKDPYYEDWNYNKRFEFIKLPANEWATVQDTFKATRSADDCVLSFDLSEYDVPAGTTFEFDDVHLNNFIFASPVPCPPAKAIRINQLGYYPELEKKATFDFNSEYPTSWELRDKNNRPVMYGISKVLGFDKDSGETAHIIDFSEFKEEGQGYYITLTYGGLQSDPFDISKDIYSKLQYDALKSFYISRSGIPIHDQYSGNVIYARPAEYAPDMAKTVANSVYSSVWLDVTGGWCDGNDEGDSKDMASSGLAVWTMMNQYERSLYNKTSSKYEDGKLVIPESGNKVPDILDESRYNLEFMLKMQVPKNNPMAGMAYHLVKSKRGMIGTNGIDYKIDRLIMPPSTVATLHLAATAAQGSRLWKNYDPDFADKCMETAKLAWDAAMKNPKVAAEHTFGGSSSDYVMDEFYWAASELFITTGEGKYLDYIKSSKHYLEVPKNLMEGERLRNIGSFDIDNTQALGTLSLITNGLPSGDIEKARNNIKSVADSFISTQDKQGYGIPIQQVTLGEDFSGYPFGSNSYVMNYAMIMAYAYDITKDTKYLNGVSESMDYIMGRNPNYKSYVKDYGLNSVGIPAMLYLEEGGTTGIRVAPPGTIVGGPNSFMYDPWVKAGEKPAALPPQKCYRDSFEDWSTNGVRMDWNASLAWITGYLDDANKVNKPARMKGDVNGDGRENAGDRTLIRRHILGIIALSGDDAWAADINDDGKINAGDLTLLTRRILTGN